MDDEKLEPPTRRGVDGSDDIPPTAFQIYRAKVQRFPNLEPEVELQHAKRWRDRAEPSTPEQRAAHVLAFEVTEIAQPVTEGVPLERDVDNADARDLARLLRPRSEWPRHRCAAERG